MLLILIINKKLWVINMPRITRQKTIIEEELNNFITFFTAEELLSKSQAKDKRIGIATIYRFLKDKTTKDSIHSYYCDRRQIYSRQKNNHCHFICTNCGKTTHFNVKDIDFIKKSINGKVCHFQIDIHGICNECNKQ